METELKKVRLTLNESIIALDARVKEFEQDLAVVERRIAEIVSYYHLASLPKEDDAAYSLPIDIKIRTATAGRTITLKLNDGKNYTLAMNELDQRLESLKLRANREGLLDESKKTETGGFASVAGRRLSRSWHGRPVESDSSSTGIIVKERSAFDKEIELFQKARAQLAAEIDPIIEPIKAKAVIDLAKFRADLSTHANLRSSLGHAKAIGDALRAELAEVPPQILTLDWNLHPSQMSLQDIHQCHLSLHNFLWHEHERNLSERQSESR